MENQAAGAEVLAKHLASPPRVVTYPDTGHCVSDQGLRDLHDFLWAFATTPGAPAFRGAFFRAFREVPRVWACLGLLSSA